MENYSTEYNFDLLPNNTFTLITGYGNHYFYVGCGFATLITNIIILFVLIRNRPLLKKSAFVVGLCFGDILNGLALLISGIQRIHYTNHGMDGNIVHRFTCLQYVTTLWLVGSQIPTVMMFLIGTERLMAVAYFSWYYKKWTITLSWALTLFVYLLVSISIGAAWFLLYGLPENETTTILCYTSNVIGVGYGSYNYGVAIVCGCTAIVTTTASLIKFVVKKRSLSMNNRSQIYMQKFVQKQWQITTSMTCVIVFDFIMVVIPNVVLLMINLKYKFPVDLKNLASWSADLVCLRSALSFFVYLALNGDFRIAFYKATNLQKKNVKIIYPYEMDAPENKNRTKF